MTPPKKQAILIISFGTSIKEAKEKSLDSFEKRIRQTYPLWEVRHAFTSKVIIYRLKMQDGIAIDTIEEALNRLKSEGFTHILIQPTYIINGIEHHHMQKMLLLYQKNFVSMKIGTPLLSSSCDLKTVISGLMENYPDLPEDVGVLFLGHGTSCSSNTIYSKFEDIARQMGYSKLYTGTIKMSSDMDSVLLQIRQSGCKKILLHPLLFLAGYHTRNEIAGSAPSSWKSRLNVCGIETVCICKGLGEYPCIQQLFLKHMASALEK